MVPEPNGRFPSEKLKKVPSSSLFFLTDLKDAMESKRKMTLSQRKNLLLTLRAMLDAIQTRKQISNENLRLFHTFEELVSSRSQREIKDPNRLLKIVEKLTSYDLSVRESDIDCQYGVTVVTTHKMLDDDYSVGDSSDFDKQKPETHRKRERVIKDNTNPPKRYPSRDSHYSLRRSREPIVYSDITHTSLGLCPSKTNPDYLDPSVFWKEIDNYYKRFDAEQITSILSHIEVDEDPCFNSQESLVLPMDSLLSCLIPENEFDSNVECPIKRPVIVDHHTIPREKGEQELAHLTPYLMDELTMLGLTDVNGMESEEEVSLCEEITKLRGELANCMQENKTLCSSLQPRFLEALKRDVVIKKDEDELNQAMLRIQNYLPTSLCVY